MILGSLVIQGLTLAPLMRALGLEDDGSEEREELHARVAAVESALARIEELRAEDWTNEDTLDRLRRLYDYRRSRFAARRDGGDSVAAIEERSIAYQRTLRELLDVQRATLVKLRNDGSISNDVMHRIEREMDLEDARLEI